MYLHNTPTNWAKTHPRPHPTPHPTGLNAYYATIPHRKPPAELTPEQPWQKESFLPKPTKSRECALYTLPWENPLTYTHHEINNTQHTAHVQLRSREHSYVRLWVTTGHSGNYHSTVQPWIPIFCLIENDCFKFFGHCKTNGRSPRTHSPTLLNSAHRRSTDKVK